MLPKNIHLQRQRNNGVWNYWYQKLLYCMCCTYEMVDLCVLNSNRRVGVWLLSWRWHISILLIAAREISANTCGLDDMYPLYDFVPVQKLCVSKYLSTSKSRSNIGETGYILYILPTYFRRTNHFVWLCCSASVGMLWAAGIILVTRRFVTSKNLQIRPINNRKLHKPYWENYCMLIATG